MLTTFPHWFSTHVAAVRNTVLTIVYIYAIVIFIFTAFPSRLNTLRVILDRVHWPPPISSCVSGEACRRPARGSENVWIAVADRHRASVRNVSIKTRKIFFFFQRIFSQLVDGRPSRKTNALYETCKGRDGGLPVFFSFSNLLFIVRAVSRDGKRFAAQNTPRLKIILILVNCFELIFSLRSGFQPLERI